MGGFLLGFGSAYGLGFGECLEAELTAGLSPFFVLFREGRAEVTDNRVSVTEHLHDVSPASDFPVQPFVGVAGPDLTRELLREHGKRDDIRSGLVEVDEGFRDFVFQSFQHSIELGVDGVGVGLVIDEVQQRLHRWPQTLRSRANHVSCIMRSEALTGCHGKGCCGCLDETSVGVTSDEFHAGQTAGR